jgi:hypothetical protein
MLKRVAYVECSFGGRCSQKINYRKLNFIKRLTKSTMLLALMFILVYLTTLSNSIGYVASNRWMIVDDDVS